MAVSDIPYPAPLIVVADVPLPGSDVADQPAGDHDRRCSGEPGVRKSGDTPREVPPIHRDPVLLHAEKARVPQGEKRDLAAFDAAEQTPWMQSAGSHDFQHLAIMQTLLQPTKKRPGLVMPTGGAALATTSECARSSSGT